MSEKISKKEEQRLLKVKQLLTDFNSDDQKLMSKALKSFQIHGDSEIIAPIIEKWNDGVSDQIEKEIIEFLCSLKNTEAMDDVMMSVLNPKFIEKRQMLLNTIWNTKVDFSDYLADFVNIALTGNFMETLECLTIIENLEGPFEEVQVLDAQMYISEYLKDGKTTDTQKAELISEIAIKLQEIERRVDEEM